MEIYYNNSLHQLVDFPTHGENILDLLFTTVPDCISNISHTPGLCKHVAVQADCDIKPELCKRKRWKVYIYRKANNEKIQEDLHQFSQKFVREQDQSPGVEENWAIFKDAIFQSLKENVPQKELKEKPGLPWITSKIQRLMKHRRKAYDRARKSGSSHHWDVYRSIHKTIKAEIKIAHDNYISGLFDDTQDGCMKKFWSFIKSQRKDKVGVSPLGQKKKQVCFLWRARIAFLRP